MVVSSSCPRSFLGQLRFEPACSVASFGDRRAPLLIRWLTKAAQFEPPSRALKLTPGVEMSAENPPQLGAANVKPAPAAPPMTAADGAAGKQPVATASVPSGSRRRVVVGVVAVAGLAAALYYGVPYALLMFSTISTDDAYVNGHVTSVAARVPGQVTKVLVDDNYRVRKGSLLVQLDKEPYRIQVALKKATYQNAEANLFAAIDEVRG